MAKAIEWYTTEQAAEYLQITTEVVRQKARDGVLPSSRVGQEFRFHKESLDNWLRSGGDAQTGAGTALDEAMEKIWAYLEETQEATLGVLEEALNVSWDVADRALQRCRRRILSDPNTRDDDEVPWCMGGMMRQTWWSRMLVRDARRLDEVEE